MPRPCVDVSRKSLGNRPFAYDIRRLAMNLPTQMTTVFERLLNDGQITAALEHIRAHLDSDSGEAVFLAAHLSISGETSEVFEERSIRQLRAAAAKSYAPAILQLGMRYLFGDSVEIDVARAATCFKSAAEAGYPPAMYEYGLALLHGKGVKQARTEARAWISRAGEGGDETAQEFVLTYGFMHAGD
ncbi:Sel1 repeat protein [compost metagenome]